jgi:DNA repair exonuclease SbcCD ATPase subunit
MTGSLLADKVKIAAFRGITEPLELDFTAPVTLVYAANGTGKTTFCEAVEWLLTGQVERLRDGAWKNDVLQSAFLDEVAPEVEATVRIGDQPHRLWRTPAGAWIDQRNGPPRSPGDFLEILAPTASAPDKHHKSAISLRQHYLRGTRFLTSEALAALVDNSPESLNRRKDVFADLLGIRHLRDAEQASGKYIAELAPFLKDLDARRKALRAEASQLRAELKDAAAAAKNADASLTAAEDLLVLSGTGLDIPDRIEAAVGAIAKGRSEQARRFKALDELSPVWSRKAEVEAQITALLPLEMAAAETFQSAQDDRKTAAEALIEAEAVARLASAQVGRLGAAEDAVVARLETTLRAAALAEPYLTIRPATLANLVEAAPETRWDAKTRAARRAQLRDAVNAEPRIDAMLSERAQVAARRGELAAQVVSPEVLQRLRSVAEASEAAASQARSDAEALAGPIATLQSAGQSVIDHQHDGDTDCPLCGHEWEGRAQLVAAVERTLNAAPAMVAAARTLASNAASAAIAARKAVTDAIQIQSQVATLDRESQDLERRLDADRQLLTALDAPLSGSDRRRFLNWAERRLDLGDALAALSAAQTEYQSIVSADGERFLDRALPIANLRGRLTQTILGRRTVLEGILRTALEGLGRAQATLAEKVTLEATRQTELESVRRDKAAAERERATISQLWTSAAGQAPWTADGLERLRGEVKAALAKLDAADNDVARAGFLGCQTKTPAKIEADLAPITARHARLKASSDVAERLQKAFRENYTATSQAQVGGLSRVVNALFLRMHANRIVDRIDLGQSESFLHWFADAGGAQLDPGRDFSQGQRQDLALALFLARARGLGGTFFLDEPVAHLDDLNRVGLMDVFRAVAIEGGGRVRLVITTSSRNLARHMVEKFSAAGSDDPKNPAMRVIELTGNGRLGVSQQQVYPIGA